MKKSTLMLSILLAVAFSATADAASKKKSHHANQAMAGNSGGAPGVDGTDAQRTKFFSDAMNPAGLK
jgi:hypothetical protein